MDVFDFNAVLPLTFTMEQLLEWRSEYGEGGTLGETGLPLVLRQERHWGEDENAYRHEDFWALYFVRRGWGTHVIDGRPWSMARGNIYLLAPGSVHLYRRTANLVLDAAYFGEDLFSPDEQGALSELSDAAPLVASLDRIGDDESTVTGHFLHLSPQRQLETEVAFNRMRRELAHPKRAMHLSARSRLWCLIVELTTWRSEMPAVMRGGESRELGEIVHYCETNFSRDLTVDQLAEATHFSRNHFTRLFTQEVGMPPATYLRHLRLQHAQKLLRETSHSIGDVAHLCGFSDATTLARAFQKGFGTSPAVYRRSNGRS
ncbi:AraC family transcriptional regulator [bacterium]|nr:MAG: AraC family transcriptional regulator [bacterium]